MTYPGAGRLVDRAGRTARAERIGRILEDFSGLRLEQSLLLDVGASHGLITIGLAKRVEFAIGVDVDRAGVAAAANEAEGFGRTGFALASGTQLPFKDECFDIVVCNHVYEHVPDAAAMMREIARVLKPGAVCYFAGGHRLQLIEPHYRLPFLSWLPRPVADRYLRLSGRGDRYQEDFMVPWRMADLFSSFSQSRDVTAAVLRSCARYGLGPAWLERLFKLAMPDWLARRASAFLPTYLWVLHK